MGIWQLSANYKKCLPRFFFLALRDLGSFIQFKNRKEQPWRSASFSKVADWQLDLFAGWQLHSSMGVFHVLKIVKTVPNHTKHQTLSLACKNLFGNQKHSSPGGLVDLVIPYNWKLHCAFLVCSMIIINSKTK